MKVGAFFDKLALAFCSAGGVLYDVATGLAAEVISEPIEEFGKSIGKRIRTHIQSKPAFGEAKRIIEALVSRMGADGEKFLDQLLRELRSEGAVRMQARGINAKVLNDMFLRSLDFNEQMLLSLECVQSLPKIDKDAVLLAFARLHQVYVEFYRDTLEADQLAFMQALAARVDNVVGARFCSAEKHLREYFESLFVQDSRGEEYLECPICGCTDRHLLPDGWVQCAANHAHKYPRYNKRLGSQGRALGGALEVKLGVIKEALFRIEEKLEQTARDVGIIRGEVKDIGKKLDIILEYFSKRSIVTDADEVYQRCEMLITLIAGEGEFRRVTLRELDEKNEALPAVLSSMRRELSPPQIKSFRIRWADAYNKAVEHFELCEREKKRKIRIAALIILAALLVTLAVSLAVTMLSGARLTDEVSGITVSVGVKDKDKALTVTEAGIKDYALWSIAEQFGVASKDMLDTRALDISLASKDGVAGPLGKITVSIPLTAGELCSKENIKVFHQGVSGVEQMQSARVVGDSVVFSTDHLSVYIVAVVPYTVEFSVLGEVVFSESRLHGSHMSVPATEREGYRFLGWTSSDEGDESITIPPEVKELFVTESVRYEAMLAPESYLVDIIVNGDRATSVSVNLTYGEQYALPDDALAKTGYTVKSITLAGQRIPECGVWMTDIDTLAEGERYIAICAEPNSYRVELDANIPSGAEIVSGDMPTALDCVYGERYALCKNNLTLKNYTFLGWGADKSKSEVVTSDGGAIFNLTAKQGDTVTLYAVWRSDEYKIKFDKNKPSAASREPSGVMQDMLMVRGGEAACLNENAYSLVGWTFLGWGTSPDSGVAYTDGVAVKNIASGCEVTLYAVWSPVRYTVIYSASGGVGSDTMVTDLRYDHAVTVEANSSATKEGHTLVGYTRGGEVYKIGKSYLNLITESDIEASGGGTVTVCLEPVWQKNTYTVSFVTDGVTEMASISYEYGSPTELPLTPVRDGYDFVAWKYSVPDFALGAPMVASDVVAYAKWNCKSVRYDSGDGGTNYRIEASDKLSIVLDLIDISELSTFFNQSYTVTFNIELCMREINAGYQEVFLLNEPSHTQRAYKVIEYGGSGNACTEWGVVRFTFELNGSDCTDVMCLRFGAYGNFSDDWYRRWVRATVTVIKK